MEHESDRDTNFTRRAMYSHKWIGTRTGGLGKRRARGNHPNYSIFEIGQKTEKSPGHLSELTQNVHNIRRSRKINEEYYGNRGMELNTGGKRLAEVKIQREIFEVIG